MSNTFEIKKKIVLSGNSRIFCNWSEHSTITQDDFLSALEWLCDDPLDDKGRQTRELALAPDRIVKLRRSYDSFGLTAFYEFPKDNGGSGGLGQLWSGEKFSDGFTRKISLSMKDRV